MGTQRLSIILVMLQFLTLSQPQTNKSNYSAPFIPIDDILLNCGFPNSSFSSLDGRTWTGDVNSTTYNPSFTTVGPTTSAHKSYIPPVPYFSARISNQPFSYSFPLGPGRKFLRLHFYPSNYTSSPPASNAIFSVTVNDDVTLLSYFSAYQTAKALISDYLIREYSVNVTTPTLKVTFIPSENHRNSYAFVNGIEILSIPDLFGNSSPLLVDGGFGTPYKIQPEWALQTFYRLNVGGHTVSPIQDSGLFRTWDDDSIYIPATLFGVTYPKDPNVTINYTQSLPAYIAPVDVYSTARSMGPSEAVNRHSNLTWIMSIDAGFYYLVRMHFCEILYPITKMNMRTFNLFLNDQTAYANLDVIGISGGLALNGLEVFKLEKHRNLAGSNPGFLPEPDIQFDNALSNLKNKKSKGDSIAIGGVVLGGVIVLYALLLSVLRMYKKVKGSSNQHRHRFHSSNASTLPSNLARHYSFEEIESATNGFNEALLLGVGGFGKVYRGKVDDESMEVAVKRGNPMSNQGVHEFQTEIEMLSNFRHYHLVSLIGYCEEKGEMILVYDYMAYGTLREHLYNTNNLPLPWKQRLEICIGAARGLHYLHSEAKQTIIHRDVKTTNILLGDKWIAKVSDFGLSKAVDNTHVSTMVKGTFGYLDPEYFRRQQLTVKSDVYSFGVVLFEVLCARPAVDTTLPEEEIGLAQWALHCLKEDILDLYVDPYLKGKIASECFKLFTETAEKCVSEQGIRRPFMEEVLLSLELALKLQESAEERGDH